jgi:hypothetical protein
MEALETWFVFSVQSRCGLHLRLLGVGRRHHHHIGDIGACTLDVTILEEEIGKIGLRWKPSSLEILRAGKTWNESFLMWQSGGENHKIKVVNSMLILGAKVDQKGSDETTLNFRASQAWIHFHERKHLFCSGHLPLRKRWNRLRDTVFRTMLHGAGGLQMCEKTTASWMRLKTKCSN